MFKLKQEGSFYGTFMTAFVWIAYFCTMGMTFYALSPVTSNMVLSGSYTQKDVGFAVSIATLVTGLFAPVATFITKKKGIKYSFITGAASLLLCGLVLSFAPENPKLYVIVYGILGGIGMSSSGTFAIGCITNEWFSKHRSIALTFVYTAGNIAGVFGLKLMNAVVKNSGWRMGWTFLSVCAACALLISVFLLVSRPSDLGQIPDGKLYEKTEIQDPEHSVYDDNSGKYFPGGNIYKFKGTYAEVLSNALRNVFYFCYMGHAALYIVEKGFDTELAVSVISTMSIANLIGRLATGFIFDKMFMPGFEMAFSCFLSAASGVIMVFGKTDSLIILTGILLGISNGIGTIATPSFSARYFGKKYYPSVSGFVSMATYLVSAVGPAFAGLIVTSVGSYFWAFLICAATSVIACAMIFIYDRKILVSK